MTVVSIVNQALVGLGAQKIATLADGTPNAEAASLFYDASRKEVLRSANWSFARKTALLVEASPTPANIPDTYDYVYDKPSDLIRFLYVTDGDYLVERHGGFYLSDDDEVTITYIWDIGKSSASPDETSLFPSHFEEALVSALRAKLAIPVGGRNASKANWKEMASFDLERAIAVEGAEESPNQSKWGVNADDDPWVGKARF